MNALVVVRVAAIALGLFVTASAAEMYKWVDEQGDVTYSELPPPGMKNVRKIAPPSPSSRGTAGYRKEDPCRGGESDGK